MPTQKYKLAVIDLTLHYPPKGGACVDVFNTFTRLQKEYSIKLFGVSWPSKYPRCQLAPTCPLPYKIVHSKQPVREAIINELLSALATWQPDVVFVADGWTLKPYIIQAVKKKYPTISRLYSYEMLCPRTNERWYYTEENPSIACDKWALTDIGSCLHCAANYKSVVEQAKNGDTNPLIEEAVVADIWRGDYHDALKSTFSTDAIIVYNSLLKDFLDNQTKTPVHIIPGGVDLNLFSPSLPHPENSCFSIFVFGRMDAASKGAETCISAGKLLADNNINFIMTITKTPGYSYPWLTETGWISQNDITKHLAKADCVIMPSLWEEAFGMTWLESMAMKVPVISSNVAGPKDYIIHKQTGLLFETGNPNDLAKQVNLLHSNKTLQKKFANNAYDMVRSKLTWDHAAAKTKTIIAKIINSNKPSS